MRMANRMDIRPRLVDLRVNEEARRVSSLAPVSPNHFSGSDVEADQVAGCHEPEVHAERVHPDVMGELGVADGYVPTDAFGETFSGEVAEDGSGVDEDVGAVRSGGGECGDSWLLG